jgi:hypothetical protein
LGWYCYSHTYHQATRNNRIHDNVFESPGNDAPIAVSDGIAREPTAGCTGWQYPGVKDNSVSNNVLISPSGKTSLYEPVGAALRSSNDTVYSGNQTFTSRAAAAAALGWVNPNRTLKSYLQDLGVAVTSADGFPEYFNAATQMRRGRWEPQWTSKAIVNYFKVGFGMEPLP